MCKLEYFLEGALYLFWICVCLFYMTTFTLILLKGLIHLDLHSSCVDWENLCQQESLFPKLTIYLSDGVRKYLYFVQCQTDQVSHCIHCLQNCVESFCFHRLALFYWISVWTDLNYKSDTSIIHQFRRLCCLHLIIIFI